MKYVNKYISIVYDQPVTVWVLGLSQKQCTELFKIRTMFCTAALKNENDWARRPERIQPSSNQHTVQVNKN